jgi:hypothetical protein
VTSTRTTVTLVSQMAGLSDQLSDDGCDQRRTPADRDGPF